MHGVAGIKAYRSSGPKMTSTPFSASFWKRLTGELLPQNRKQPMGLIDIPGTHSGSKISIGSCPRRGLFIW
jgi:hypothetical protein